ncbi:segregation/condensation protein A [Candidatus Woesearchaeota archaeon]|nr:segregation/condensation protein A [Candidatus Woesearchaeota archaeon]
MEDRVFEIVLKGDEITWKALILDLVREEQMDPWNIDISRLTKRYMEMLRKLKGMDLRVSGKVVLAAAILLRMKSTQLLEEDIVAFDHLMAGEEESSLLDGLEQEYGSQSVVFEKKNLIPRTPQPRKRKVSVYDLIDALQKALEVNRRRMLLQAVPAMTIPERKFDITAVMKDIYQKIVNFFQFNRDARLTFYQLVPADTKESKVLTFIPLLHLANDRKIDLEQEEPFGEIEIRLRTEQEISKELAGVGA